MDRDNAQPGTDIGKKNDDRSNDVQDESMTVTLAQGTQTTIFKRK